MKINDLLVEATYEEKDPFEPINTRKMSLEDRRQYYVHLRRECNGMMNTIREWFIKQTWDGFSKATEDNKIYRYLYDVKNALKSIDPGMSDNDVYRNVQRIQNITIDSARRNRMLSKGKTSDVTLYLPITEQNAAWRAKVNKQYKRFNRYEAAEKKLLLTIQRIEREITNRSGAPRFGRYKSQTY